jgi:hypothetical protein
MFEKMTAPTFATEHFRAFNSFSTFEAEAGKPANIQPMTSSDLPENLLRLLESSIPAFSAAELLLFLVHHADRPWSTREIVRAIRPVSIAASAIDEYLALFKVKGLVTEEPSTHFRYTPASPELADAVAALDLAYNERPVTLIRTICALEDRKIQSFADSFQLKKGDSNGR